MGRYSTVAKVGAATGVSAAAALGIWIHDWLNAQHVNSGAALATAVVVIPISQKVFAYIGETAFAYLPWLRRLLLGKEFIEGTWVDVVYQGDRPIQIGVVCVEAAGASVAFHGENHDLAGKSLGTFRSDVVTFDWPKLTMVGWNDPDGTRQESPRSYCEIQFASGRSAAQHYSGFFTFMNEGQRFMTRGWRVKTKEHLWELADPHSRQQAIVKLAHLGMDQTPAARATLQVI